MRAASCTCGAVRIEADGEPERVSVCHCLACQQRTGSVFGAQAVFRVHVVRPQGDPALFVRVGDSGNPVTFPICATCGRRVRDPVPAAHEIYCENLAEWRPYESHWLGWSVASPEFVHLERDSVVKSAAW